MRATPSRHLIWLVFVFVHAGLTLLFFLGYVNYAMKVDHGQVAPSLLGQVSQYAKSVFLLPLLLPLLRWRTDLVAGPLGYVFLFLNSAIWALCAWWLTYRIRRRQAAARAAA